MSLQVWLPLNGNSNNQGLSNTIFSSGSEPLYSSSGKLDKSFTMNTYLYNDNFTALSGGIFSVAYWVKYTDWPQYNEYCVSLNNTDSTDYMFMLGVQSSSGLLSVNMSSSEISLELNTWYHVAYTYDGTTGILYLDGEQIKTWTDFNCNNSAIHLTVNGRYGSRPHLIEKSFLNDLRIYDHVLSVKEIREISKGLILHYPLRGGEGGINLFKGHKEYYATSSGITEFGSELIYDDSILPLNSLIGKTVTFTFDYSVEGEKLNTSGGWEKQRFGAHLSIDYVDPTGTTITTYPCTDHLHQGVTAEGTGRAIQTYTFPADWQSIIDFRISPGARNQPAANNTATWYMKNFKVELGDTDTGYSLNPNDVGDMGHIADCAGYNHHGETDGILTYNLDSPRHDISTHIEGANRINLFNLPYETMDNGTLSFWLKVNKFKGWSHYVFIADVFDWTGTERDFIIVANRYEEATEVETADVILDCCSYTSAHSMTIDQWYHIAFTWDAKNYIIKKYINGNCVYTHDDSSNKRLDIYRSKHGAHRIGPGFIDPYYGNYNISDFRIYSTTMFEADIKELYQTPISVDKAGNSFAMEYIEDTAPHFYKNGVIENSYIHENAADDSDTLTTFHINSTKTFANQIYEV